jgi:L-cysteine S-thiosulfotransferase
MSKFVLRFLLGLPGCLLAGAAALAQGVPEQGFRIISTGTLGNCVACHALPGQRDLPSTFGPSFDKIGTRLDAQALREWVTDARKRKPDTLMPPFGTTEGTNASVRAQSMLSEEQIAHVVAALLTLR